MRDSNCALAHPPTQRGTHCLFGLVGAEVWWKVSWCLPSIRASTTVLAQGQRRAAASDPGDPGLPSVLPPFVALGLTNAQVAVKLVISPRTVNAHLRSIYSKLEITSRNAVIRYAFDHHLI